MAFTALTALALGAGATSAYSSYRQGKEAKKEGYQQAEAFEIEAQGYEEQADLLNIEQKALDQKKILEEGKYRRAKSQMASTITAKTAKSGFKLSGSPLAVMIDNLTQLELDESIAKSNIDLEKFNVYGQQKQYLSAADASRRGGASAISQGKSAYSAGKVGAFTSLLQTGASAYSPSPKASPKTFLV